MISVAIDWVCIGSWIYCTLEHISCDFTVQITVMSQSQSSLHWLVMPSNMCFQAGGHLTPISYSCNYHFKTVSYWQLALVIRPWKWLHRKHLFHYWCVLIAMETCLLAEPLLNNGRCLAMSVHATIFVVPYCLFWSYDFVNHLMFTVTLCWFCFSFGIVSWMASYIVIILYIWILLHIVISLSLYFSVFVRLVNV
jgi:hypothetical protein